MGDARGFLKVSRRPSAYRPVCDRVNDFQEVALPRPEPLSQEQASRCMDCGTPFCSWACPLGNYIPEWNDLLYRGNWRRAFEMLRRTNNLPEVTGRVCPALCEYSCVLGLNDDAVTIRENEMAVIEHAFAQGLISARPPLERTGKNVAVIGSGPAGLACADQLNQAGHTVTIMEKDDALGGILRYGIPDFKLDKSVLDRRLSLLRQEGIVFRTGMHAGVDMPAADLLRMFDAICLTGGSRYARDLSIPGRELQGIYLAMDFLIPQNRRVAGTLNAAEGTSAEGKTIVIIGGGDTGADCMGVAHRQKAGCIVQVELLPQPPGCRTDAYPWPRYPLVLKTSTSHEEGGERHWSVLTKRFLGEGGRVTGLECVRVEFTSDPGNGCPAMKEVPGSEFTLPADMVILAMGFVHPEHDRLLSSLGVEFDGRGNVKTDVRFMTAQKGVFAAGDIRRGQSLIVWAISEGRTAAHHIDTYLAGSSQLPRM